MKEFNKEAWRIEKAEKLNAIMEQLDNGVKDVCKDGGSFAKYLSVMAKFNRYSLNNTILIAMQSHDRGFVGPFAGYKDWEKKFKRKVKRGEKGIKILAPQKKKIYYAEKDEDGNQVEKSITKTYFRQVSVFDVSQTDGEPLPDFECKELDGTVLDFEKLIGAVKKLSPVPIRVDEITNGAKGYYSNTDKEIVIKKDLSELHTVKTMLHEITHSILHDADYMRENGIEKDKETRETEAESVAYVVCSYLGLDTSEYSFNYIASWGSSRELKGLKASMENIKSLSNKFIQELSIELSEDDKQKESIENISVVPAEDDELIAI